MEWCWRSETKRDAVAIVRVSTAKQGEGISPTVQEEEISKYCTERNLKIVKTVILEESAKDSENREEYSKELKNILKSKIYHFVYYASDREARNMTDPETNTKLIKAGMITVHHVNDRRVYWKGSTANDFFIRNIYAARNANFCDNLSERVFASLEKKAQLGWYPNARPPLGYIGRRQINEFGKESAKGLSIIVPDPNQDAIALVKREFELRALGYSFREIRKRILDEGWKLPRSIKKYSEKSIDYRLKSKFYHGYFDFNGVEYKGNHELIIPEDILRKVKRSFMPGADRVVPEKNSIFGGWIRCGHEACNNVIIYDPKEKFLRASGETKVYHYYHCANSRGVHESLKGLSISEEELWAAFEKGLPTIAIPEALATDILHAMMKRDKEASTEKKKQTEQLKKSLSDLEKKEEFAYENFESGAIDLPMYRRQCERIKVERERISAALSTQEKIFSATSYKDVSIALELCKNLKILWKGLEKKNRVKLLKSLYSNPKLEAGTIEFNLRKPFSVINKMKGQELWYLRSDSN